MTLQAQLEQVAAAFEQRDYKTVAQLLKPLIKSAPDHPWVQLYAARYQEVSGKPEAAEAAYRKLLKGTSNPKLALQARQGLQRIETAAQERQQEALAQATADPNSSVSGFLIVEPVSSEDRQAAAQNFARIMKIDPYTARVHLSQRSWRLYRTGAIGELQFYSQQLNEAGISSFCVPLPDVQKIRVFRVQHLQAASPQPTIVCLNEADQLGTLAFDWSEVSRRVEGLLPIFEEVIDVGAWNKLKRREQTQDYAQLVDLHLPKRKCILRFCDSTYQFQQGMIFDVTQSDGTRMTQTTNRIRWNNLDKFLTSRLPNLPTWSDFTPFAESAIEHLSLVGSFKSHIDVFRKDESYWDQAFHLYSSLVFIKES
ncbi:tetratricopeptide repeat protein [Oscillatoria sp. FACHB-1407]|uniref:tetratricopeptide repeat protein n=1 Tax=Oscillatoria sp. FACHB-1407 TaxID=2692847 RepID=UPI001688BE40|nr:tetratricopeptide repeat protein [Oscillatoria sp. FACHB-1407]MBD2463792.1 tetratricopeptide repeat protein [Oscillatoria sp. FACHB-1407]